LNNNKSAKDIEQIKKQDYATNKLLITFTLAFGFIIFFMNIGRMMKDIRTYISAQDIVKTSVWVAVGIVAAGIIVAVIERAVKRNTKYKIFTGVNIAAVAAFFALCAAFLGYYSFTPETLTLLYIFIPAIVVLLIIFHSYQREFFMLSLASAIGGIGIWLIGSGIVSDPNKVVILVYAAVAVLAAITVWAQAGKGTIKLFGKKLEIFKSDARYLILYLTYALVIALVATALLVADIAIWFVFGLIGYIILAGIYYTVKLI